MLSDYSCDEILTELGLRFMNSNGIEFCDREKLEDVRDEIIYFLLESENENRLG